MRNIAFLSHCSVSKRNEIPSEQKSDPRAEQSGQTRQESSKTQNGAELGKYAKLADELEQAAGTISALHRQRTEFGKVAEELKAKQEIANDLLCEAQSPQAEADLAKELDAIAHSQRVNAARIAGTDARVQPMELELQTRLPLAFSTFQRLQAYLLEVGLKRARDRIVALLEPSWRDAPEVKTLAEHETDYVALTKLRLPGLSWAVVRSLSTEPEPHWSNLVRPFTPHEREENRRQTVSAMLEATGQLCAAARDIIENCAQFSADVPPFVCAPEPPPPPPEIHPEYNEPLHSSEREFAIAVAKTGGKDYDTLPPEQKAIVDAMVAERRKHPISYGFTTGWQMVGSTVEDTP